MGVPARIPPFNFFKGIIASQKEGQPAGIVCICSANHFVIEAAMHWARNLNFILCIESTAEQVNQFGGYTGLKPADFVSFVSHIASVSGFSLDRLILGGDHLGPRPWRKEPAEAAMAKSRDLVRAYLRAGYRKIHLDTGVACLDDCPAGALPLDPLIVAQRSADLFEISERVFPDEVHRPVYIVGNEVPPPGGFSEAAEALSVSKVADVTYFISAIKRQLHFRELNEAWERVIAVVVQPGIEFGPESIKAYDRGLSSELVEFIRAERQLVYEAHSTDYQTEKALADMVADQFAILKVGPELTFALRAALFALSFIEEELLSARKSVILSELREVIDKTMLQNPAHWVDYYRGDEQYCRFARSYGLSDRIRYYWPAPPVVSAVERLLLNLQTEKLPLGLIHQYFPKQFDRIRESFLLPTPLHLVYSQIEEVIVRYMAACRIEKHPPLFHREKNPDT